MMKVKMLDDDIDDVEDVEGEETITIMLMMEVRLKITMDMWRMSVKTIRAVEYDDDGLSGVPGLLGFMAVRGNVAEKHAKPFSVPWCR